MAPCSIKELVSAIVGVSSFSKAGKAPYDAGSDLAFPRDLRILQKSPKPLVFESDGCRWFRPTRLQQLLALKSQHPQAKLVGGNSEIGVEMRLKSMDYRYFIDTSNVEELRGIAWDDSSMTIGVNITLTEFIDSLKARLAIVKVSGSQTALTLQGPPAAYASSVPLQPAMVRWAPDPQLCHRRGQHRHRLPHLGPQPHLHRH